MSTAPSPIAVNRAPVLTLWATVVAERLGYSPETALTLGRTVCSASARTKARRHLWRGRHGRKCSRKRRALA